MLTTQSWWLTLTKWRYMGRFHVHLWMFPSLIQGFSCRRASHHIWGCSSVQHEAQVLNSLPATHKLTDRIQYYVGPTTSRCGSVLESSGWGPGTMWGNFCCFFSSFGMICPHFLLVKFLLCKRWLKMFTKPEPLFFFGFNNWIYIYTHTHNICIYNIVYVYIYILHYNIH